MNEHDGEPIRGLPAPLPAGERILWQGGPRWQTLARRALHVDKIAVYVALMLLWRAATDVADGAGLTGAGMLTPLALAAVAIPTGLAWLMSRAAVYTVTSRRVIMRFGVALPMTLNLPFRVIASAALKVHADGTGDIPLCLTNEDRVSYVLLWPHARRWRISRPEPTLRSIPDAAKVAEILSRALSAAAGQPAQAIAAQPEPAGMSARPAVTAAAA